MPAVYPRAQRRLPQMRELWGHNGLQLKKARSFEFLAKEKRPV
jgi:hypothetical protein